MKFLQILQSHITWELRNEKTCLIRLSYLLHSKVNETLTEDGKQSSGKMIYDLLFKDDLQ